MFYKLLWAFAFFIMFLPTLLFVKNDGSEKERLTQFLQTFPSGELNFEELGYIQFPEGTWNKLEAAVQMDTEWFAEFLRTNEAKEKLPFHPKFLIKKKEFEAYQLAVSTATRLIFNWVENPIKNLGDETEDGELIPYRPDFGISKSDYLKMYEDLRMPKLYVESEGKLTISKEENRIRFKTENEKYTSLNGLGIHLKSQKVYFEKEELYRYDFTEANQFQTLIKWNIHHWSSREGLDFETGYLVDKSFLIIRFRRTNQTNKIENFVLKVSLNN